MKVVCINNIGSDHAEFKFTINKIYEIDYDFKEGDGLIFIHNDDGDKRFYPGRFFKPLDELREEKINQILK